MKKYSKFIERIGFIKFEWQQEYLIFLLNIRNNSDFLKLCTKRNNVVNLEEFRNELKNDFNDDRYEQYIIINSKDNLIGTVYSYSFNRMKKYFFFSIFLVSEYRKYGYGVGAILGFLKMSFAKNDLEKIYFDVYEYNDKVLNMTSRLRKIFEKVEQFTNRREIDNDKYDILRFVVYRNKVNL